ncbi:PA2169 family four-helix-bundle protein [Arenimonas oryziterrae]|uniref:DUF2383 domain-containing protein n=1 Tax=Arenimonas oryziterrae DSM 21050 = YC6267 TaxID=1121015 RepID=A0A091AQY0_9GAMM|nr:PA2169 family four-helix-bundle protein [Arenimonas oryziterrae]KFN42578.1 hypothetical protein N789_13135 [Arenimonas oryziterrae DSM 21050 = YC6267]
MNHSNKNLNDLVSIARDGKDFYEHAAAKVDDPALKTVFTRMASVKNDIVQSLSGEIRAEGDKPTTAGTLVGEIGKIYGDLRALVGNKDYAYVAQLEESEDRLLKAFTDAIADKETSAPARAVLDRLAPIIRECHNSMRDRKLALKNAA